MIINGVKLVNFRSHKEYELKCDEMTSLILGPNGSGKTSVLEGIYEAMRGKSFRAVDREIVRRGEEFYRVELVYQGGEKVVVTYEDGVGKKAFFVGDKKWGRLPKKNRYPIVLFLPDDLHLVGASPSRRRDYFDRVLAELDLGYAKALSGYNRALRQRNELLKTENATREAVFSWNILLSKYGCELRAKRLAFVEGINGDFTGRYRSIAENDDRVELLYGWSSDTLGSGRTTMMKGDGINPNHESQYLSILERDFERDSLLGHTSYGAHRDNYSFRFNGVEAEGSASRGETRSMVVAMKFIEAEMIFKQTGRKPVVLLDDVFSELDAKRQKCLVTNFKDNQVILTSVE